MSPIAFFLLVAWCAALTAFDIRHCRLPNSLTAAGAVIIFGYALFTTQFTAASVGAMLLALPYLVVHLAAPDAFGAGDVKLAVGLGAVAALGGAQSWVAAALAAPVLTATAGVAVLTVRRIRAGDDRAGPHPLPHGPAMCFATVLSLAAVHA
ncbi:A24 family peptidase [Nocardia sp. NBC_00565]|uniref:A24 family peptidase n=1 Tax=Nocardia sp. NBC_00565 TaxID=2975993 RepID=UPI002E822233|nr:A24 family peptidase [Nocardia sp. NBC_00565]WUC07155.1 A24 family peptidase [Nocardia sp. NBC_00565]